MSQVKQSSHVATRAEQAESPAQVTTEMAPTAWPLAGLTASSPVQRARAAKGLNRSLGNARLGKLMSPPLQRQDELEEEEPLQGRFESLQLQAAENRTGMPDQLKAGLEQLSGTDLSGLRVHHNSPKPAQLNALAYAQGQDIHLAPGQEEHLAHEGWHAVQQMQGRVKPTIQAQGVAINDDERLEREADVMGAKALQMQRPDHIANGAAAQVTTAVPLQATGFVALQSLGSWTSGGGAIQRKLWIGPTNKKSLKKAKDVKRKVPDKPGGTKEIAEILANWAQDAETQDRTFNTWAEAIAAARASEGEGLPWRKILWGLFFIFLVMSTLGVAGVLVPRARRYEVRGNMGGAASIARRPLEPLMNVGEQAQIGALAMNSNAQRLCALTQSLPLEQILHENPMVETLIPDAATLRNATACLEAIGPQLEALEGPLDRVRPVLEEIGPNVLQNPAGTGVYHEHVFLAPRPTQSPVRPPFPDQEEAEQSPLRPPDIGFFEEGVRTDKPEMMPEYGEAVAHYDRDLMEKAALAVARDYGKYKGMTHNCQDFAHAVVTAYGDLGGRQLVPTYKSQAVLVITDLVIDYLGSVLDGKIDDAVADEFKTGTQTAPTECAVEVATKLGVSDQTFGGLLDEVLNLEIDVGQTGVKVPLRMVICNTDALDEALEMGDAMLDKTVDLPEEGRTTLREALCSPKGRQGENVLEGILYEFARVKGAPKILEELPSFIKNDKLARDKLVSELTRRLAKNLYNRLNLKGLC